jgi:hypothetical protein
MRSEQADPTRRRAARSAPAAGRKLAVGLLVGAGTRDALIRRVAERLSERNIEVMVLTVGDRPVVVDSGRVLEPGSVLTHETAGDLDGSIVLLTDEGAEQAASDARALEFLRAIDGRGLALGYNEGSVPLFTAAAVSRFRERDEVVWINGTLRALDDFAEECWTAARRTVARTVESPPRSPADRIGPTTGSGRP